MKMFGLLTVSSGLILLSLSVGVESTAGAVFSGLGILWSLLLLMMDKGE